jgi:hypothetical protein
VSTAAITPDHLHVGLAQVADLSQLTAAWDDVLASDRDDGVLGPGVARFARDAEQHLAEMAAQLAVGTVTCASVLPAQTLSGTAWERRFPAFVGATCATGHISAGQDPARQDRVPSEVTPQGV